ncbi:DUF2183 domain-containing protein [Lutimonas halocynthiae]|uniref:phosphatidate phosphatase App1 family protein n=1 Tax=Lutimonas halocynthiae TaxID=1446477 RepID=UPI0025B60D5B|nr:phosphatase domain-containing protein [Lutimonas halocynthiae]MDN3642029.1 DUF2183 domain-containing protein [Lutimonas halocynthiae]
MAYLWHLSSVQFNAQTVVTGLILQGKLSYKNASSGILRNASQTIAGYFKKPFANKIIVVKIDEQVIETTTDQKGSFSFTIERDIENDILVYTSDQEEIPIHQNYPVFFKNSKTEQLVISDIDDTIMRSYTQTYLKRMFTTLFYRGHRRELIPSTNGIYQILLKKNASFFYVSKSEFNLVRLIAEFLMHHSLPLGPLFLTPYLSVSELISNTKDPAFKFKSICFILDRSKDLPVVLIGDDTQADMEVYTQIVKKYGRQISKVFIRQTNNKRSSKQTKNWNNLIASGVDASYFTNKDLETN